MIAYLEGKIIEKFDKSVIIAVNGVGYEVSLAGPTIEQFKINDNVSIYAYTYIREEQIAIYGFASSEELIFFKKVTRRRFYKKRSLVLSCTKQILLSIESTNRPK